MSEALAGIPEVDLPPAEPMEASVAVLYRWGSSGLEVFWLQRDLRLRFAGGFYAFPGGREEPADGEVLVRGAESREASARASCARELFEETGVLLARGQRQPTSAALAEARRELLQGESSFSDLLAAHRLHLDAADFPAAGRWVTPEFMPVRFDARFFLVEAPEGARAEIVPGELASGEWISPAAALARWKEGSVLLHPPNLHALAVLSQWQSREQALSALRDQPDCEGDVARRIEFQQGIHLFPLRTPTLPPATHTNCLLLGNGELLIVDPGAPSPAETDRLIRFLSSLATLGRRPLAVFLTHHHGDHVGGAAQVCAELKIPLWAHRLTADRVSLRVERHVEDGETLELLGDPPMRFTALHTPGHARGHLCLRDQRSGALVGGDMVAGVGTIVIDPPEGNMREYLTQLARLRDLSVGAIYPAHGPVIVEGRRKLEEYLSHREEREQKVLTSLAPEGTTVPEVVARAYQDTPGFLHPIAERSALASLEKLMEEGKVRAEGDRYFLT